MFYSYHHCITTAGTESPLLSDKLLGEGMSLFEHYIRELYDIRSLGAGVNELSYYPALSNLLNGIGGTLSPQVRCVMNLKNLGAGMPDGGLFTPNQFSKSLNVMPLEPGNPERGVIEVKGTKDDAWIIAQGKQVSGYWGKYRQVLVTNLRDFVLLGQDSSGNQVKLEKYSLAPSEQAFWTAATHPHTMADQHEENFIAFLKRVMLHNAPLTTPQEVAWFLASYAREARTRVDRAHLDALTAIRTALEAALGFTFRGEQGDRFFAQHWCKHFSTAFSLPGSCGARNTHLLTHLTVSIGKVLLGPYVFP